MALLKLWNIYLCLLTSTVATECLDGMYSEFCNRTCGKCFDGQPCNKDTGECLHGCEPGWTGILCNKGFRNFALNKRAYQSSTEIYNNFYWTADKAVDGNTDGRNPDAFRTCSATDVLMENHTWEVDIGFLIIVKTITVDERSDGNDQLSGFQVFTGTHSKPWIANKPLMKAYSGHFQHLFRASDSLSRFISVMRQNKWTLTLCEVVVHGECIDGMYSEFCNRTCGKCFDDQPCNKDTGECLRGCEPGWTGILCDKGLRNFALNKRAYQSSTKNYTNFDWTADKAVDGNTDGINPDASRTCSETDVRMENHTWEVDIGFLIIVNTITVMKEAMKVNDQLSGFQVFTGTHSKPWIANQPLTKASSGHFQHLFRASDSVAWYISVIRQNKWTLTLCEVVVHGECIDGVYSEFCNRTCGKCFDNQPCNKDTGECPRGCEPGWTGIFCDEGQQSVLHLDRKDSATITTKRTVRLDTNSIEIPHDAPSNIPYGQQSTVRAENVPVYVIPVIIGAVGVVMVIFAYLIRIQRMDTINLETERRHALVECDTDLYLTPIAAERPLPVPPRENGPMGNSIHQSNTAHNAQYDSSMQLIHSTQPICLDGYENIDISSDDDRTNTSNNEETIYESNETFNPPFQDTSGYLTVLGERDATLK